MDLSIEFDRAITIAEYIDLLEDKKALHDLHYRKAEVSNGLADMGKLNILVITEPWCGDSTAILPVLIKIFENYDSEIRVVLRDQNPDLMDHFLTRGARAIPIVLVMNENHELIMKFGPRPQKAQNIYEEHRSLIESSKIEKKEVINKIRNFYARDRGNSIANEFVSNLKKTLSFSHD